MKKHHWFMPLLALTAANVYGQSVSEADYQRAEQRLSKNVKKLVLGTVEYPVWNEQGKVVYRSNTDKGYRFYLVNPVNGKKVQAFDHQKLAESLARVTETRVNADELPFNRIDNIDEQHIAITVKGIDYRCQLSSYICQQNKQAARDNEQLSPDGKKAVFIRDFNLWIRDVATNQESQLTQDGIKDFGYATNNAGWIRSDKPVVKWSPDSKKIATFKHDGRNVGEMGIVSTNVGHPDIDVWKYPLPGDENIFKIHRVVIDVEKSTIIPLDMPVDDHRSTITDHVAGRDGQLLDIDWAENSQRFAFVSSSRDHKTATLKIADATTGKVSTVFTETTKAFFESGVGGISWQFLDKTNEVVWFSQKTNWGHLYLIDINSGKVKQAITEGDWTVLKLLHVDQEKGQLLFTGAGREGADPYYHSLYRVNKDGSNLTLLTPEKEHHRITLSADGMYFVDRVSTPTAPERSFLRSVNSDKSIELERMDINALTASGWQAPHHFVVKDRNGEHDIHGLYFLPSNFDASKKYPVVNYLYPGPQVGSIRGRHFQAARRDHQALAELGFIVVEIDALGTPGRSKAFHNAYYANMGDSGIPDQVAAIKQLAKKYSWMDLDRVGIWGHSGGGFASTRALLLYPDFYKVAVSQAGNHDNRNYADEWGEKFHGLLVNHEDGTTNYDSQANQLIAKNLKGKLLLVHGTTDTNVPPYNTLLVVEALIAANKDFDMLMLPNRGHSFAMEAFMLRKRWDYFVKHLMGATPPKEYQFSH